MQAITKIHTKRNKTHYVGWKSYALQHVTKIIYAADVLIKFNIVKL